MRYRAFISYSHADEAWARWLIRRLETYRVPRRLVGQPGRHGPVPTRLGAFFRDRDELTASSDLSTTIRAALVESETLIVVCSPAAAASRWVDAEVQAFRDSGRGDRVLAFVVAGDPGQEAFGSVCFPPSLIAPDADGRPTEPLAADARREADGRERAFLKLVAGLLGIGFDQLARREAQRKQRKLLQVALASLAGMAIAIGLAITAYVARNDAQRRQAQAEDILGFMLGDLREKLATVGRLDLMRAVDDKATGYFATLDPRDLSDRALEEQARSLTGIGQVRLEEGNHDEAMLAFREAHARSTALYERAPERGQRLFDLAQAEYWIGFVGLQQGDYDTAERWFTRYRDSAIQLAAMDRGNFDWQREVAYGHHNLAVMDQRRGRFADAEREMLKEVALLRGWIRERPGDLQLRFDAADTISWLGTLATAQGRLESAEAYFAERVELMQRSMADDPENANWKDNSVNALAWLATVQADLGNTTAASANVAKATSIATALVAQDPSNNSWRSSLARCRLLEAELNALQQPLLAATATGAAESELLLARAAEPKSQNVLSSLVRAHNMHARLALARGDLDTARLKLASAFRLIEPEWRMAPNEEMRIRLAETRLLQGDIESSAGRAHAAVAAWTQAKQLMLKSPTSEIAFARLDSLLRAQLALGEGEAAARTRARLEASGYRPLQPFPSGTPVAAR